MAKRRRDSEIYLTVAQAADVLGLCQDTVYRMAARGDLLCMHFGRAIRIPRGAVDPKPPAAQAGARGGLHVCGGRDNGVYRTG